MRKLSIQLAALAGVLTVTMWPLAVGAATFLADEKTDVNQAVDEDVYAAGDVVSIRGDVKGDVFAVGSTVETTQQVQGDVFAAGQSVMVRGSVMDDVLAAGNSILIEPGTVDDVFAAGSSVMIGEATQVTGDAYLAGASVVIQGKVAGTVRVASENVRLGSQAEVTGDLITYGEAKPRIVLEDGALVRGEQKHVSAPMPDKGAAAKTAGAMWAGDWARRVITWTILSWLLIALAPVLAAAVVTRFKTKPWAGFGWGALWLLALMPVMVMLLVTVIGAPVAAVLGLATAALFIFATAYAHIVTGSYLARYIFRNRGEGQLSWREALVGALVLASVRLVPVLGGLVTMVITWIAFGSLLAVLGRMLRPAKTA